MARPLQRDSFTRTFEGLFLMLLVTQPEGESAARFPQAPGCVLNIYTFSILLLLFMA